MQRKWVPGEVQPQLSDSVVGHGQDDQYATCVAKVAAAAAEDSVIIGYWVRHGRCYAP